MLLPIIERKDSVEPHITEAWHRFLEKVQLEPAEEGKPWTPTREWLFRAFAEGFEGGTRHEARQRGCA